MANTWMETGKLVYRGQQWVYNFITYQGAKAHANLMNEASYQFEYRVEQGADGFYYIAIYDHGKFWTYH